MFEKIDECRRHQESQLGLARVSDAIKPAQRVVDTTGMAHDEMARAGRGQIGRELLGVVSARRKIGKTGESVVERMAGAPRRPAETERERIDLQSFGGEGAAARDPGRRIRAVANEDCGHAAPGERRQQGRAHAWQNMHMLVPVDMAGRSAERITEGVNLAADLVLDLVQRQDAAQGGRSELAKARQLALQVACAANVR